MKENKNSKARIAANNRYNAKAYDRINIAVKKGKKDIIKQYAERKGESINRFIENAIDEKIEREAAENNGLDLDFSASALGDLVNLDITAFEFDAAEGKIDGEGEL